VTSGLTFSDGYTASISLGMLLDRTELDRLLRTFSGVVRRQIDRSITDKLRHELLDTTPPAISPGTMGQLAKWCKTNNPLYWEGMDIAQKISQLLFGTILDRSQLGV